MISNWLAFAVLIYGLGVGAKWWPGPVATVRRLKASRQLDDGADGDEEPAQPVTMRAATPDAHATRTGTGRDIEGDKPQDIDGDMRHDVPAPGLWARLRQAVDLVIHPDTWDDDAETDDGVASDQGHASPSVTLTAAPPPKVVVQYVPEGGWTGNVAALDADGNQVILQYRTRSELAAPLPALSSADDEDQDDDGAEVASIDEVALRQDWLRAIETDGRFSNAEITQMYREKWGRGRRTLERDRAVLADTSAPRSRSRPT